MPEGSDSSSRLIPTTGLGAESMSVKEGAKTTSDCCREQQRVVLYLCLCLFALVIRGGVSGE
jgi:hypothetical protein